MREAPPPFPVFYSVSTPQRGARLRAWLDRGGDNWCRIELPPMHPQDFDVRWEPPVYGSPVRIYLSPSTNASSAGPQQPLASTAWPQLRVGGASPDQPLFVLNAPYGNLRNQIEKGHRVGRAKSGLGSGHKVANAYFHLRAIQCLAARCHPCLQRIGVHAAAVFEDDVEYVQGSSPGDAATLPQLLHAAAAQTRARDGVTKLQLGVGNAGSGQEVNVASRKARCHEHTRGVAGWPTARLLACSNYTDSHAYVLHASHARKIVAAHASLVEHGGRGSRRCVNPWGHVSCASDPGILRDFFKQCDKALPALHPSHDKLRCSGLALAGQHTPWSLKHNNDDAFRMDSDEGTDVYPVIAALQRAIFENAKNRSRMRVSLRALRRDGMPRKVRGTHVMKT